MFWHMVKSALFRQGRQMLFVSLTVALGISLATAMLTVMFDVGAKVNQELKAFGANITVTPKNASIVHDIYGLDGTGPASYLQESDLGKIKTIFWTNNIVALSPHLDGTVQVEGRDVPVTGTWFDHAMNLPTGETFATGEEYMKSWWQVAGAWPKEKASDEVLLGKNLADRLQVKEGDTLSWKRDDREGTVRVTGIVTSGGEEDDKMVAPLALVQSMLDLDGRIGSITVSAITTPENDLARKAAADPKSLTMKEYEVWYCTAYVGSIAYQIEEVVSGSVARPVRQIAESEGRILDKTELLMLLITILSLLSATLGVSNLVSANIMERSRELGLLKALGASDLSVVILVLTEIMAASLAGGAAGLAAGMAFAEMIGRAVFGSSISLHWVVVPVLFGLLCVMVLLGSIPAVRTILRLRPAIVLHGR